MSVEKAERKPVPRLKPAAREPEPEGGDSHYSLDLLPPDGTAAGEQRPFDSKDILTRKYKRPARRVVPSPEPGVPPARQRAEGDFQDGSGGMTSRCSRPRRAGTPPTGSCPGKNPAGAAPNGPLTGKSPSMPRRKAGAAGAAETGGKKGEAKPAAAQSPRRAAAVPGQPAGERRSAARPGRAVPGGACPNGPPTWTTGPPKDSTEQNS